ncbi:MAG: hypothetical protein IJK58_04535 [Clostridia bacterium]|nr:hypothetical protein [Clostridia bacterium]
MNSIEIKYIDLYKSVDSICKDIFRNERHFNDRGEEVFGVSAYVETMESERYSAAPRPQDWDVWYKKLKRLRWLRNTIVHDSGTSECDEEDYDDLERFYNELINGNDILARARRLRAATSARKRASAVIAQRPAQSRTASPRKKSYVGWAVFGIVAAVAALAFIVYYFLK